jgi:hypothetical protein
MVTKVCHYLTYQHNVQSYFRDHADKYDGVLIPLSIATAFPSATYGFVRALCAKNKNKHYAIDPRTPLFQKAWDRANVRPPHKRMAEVMGPPFTTKGLASRLEPPDFHLDSVLNAVTEACLKFQQGFRTSQDDARKLRKYQELLGLSEVNELGEPQFLIPPYFQFENLNDSWYRISLRCIRAAKAYAANIPIRPVLHFHSWSSIPDWLAVDQALGNAGVQALWLYPNHFKEHDADLDSLVAYRKAVQAALNTKLVPYSLFGGYFAILLFYSGLKGFSNGIGFGEWRDSGYHRGGTATNRVYVLKLHRYLDGPLAQTLIDKDAEYFGMDTELLAGCVDGQRPLTTLSQAECLDHFIECRKMELDFVSSNSVGNAIQEIEDTLDHLDEVGPLERMNYGASLERWRDAIK